MTPLQYPRKLRKELAHFRVDDATHSKLRQISKQYDVKMTELCRMAVEQLVLVEWPRLKGSCDTARAR